MGSHIRQNLTVHLYKQHGYPFSFSNYGYKISKSYHIRPCFLERAGRHRLFFGLSRKLLNEYTSKNGFTVAKAFRVSESASGKQIPEDLQRNVQYTEKHRIPIILCEKIDRLTRNLKDAASVSDWINENAERQVHFVKESFIVNKNTRAHENLVWDMKVAIARFYTNNLSEDPQGTERENRPRLASGKTTARIQNHRREGTQDTHH